MTQTDRTGKRSVKLCGDNGGVTADELMDVDECRGTQNQPETTYGLN